MAPTFLKQYGGRRTGTNLLRTLVAESFHDVVVLMHVLGDKHSAPVDLDRLRDETAGSKDPSFELVTRATWDRPAATTRPDCPKQQAFLREVAAPLFEAVRSDRLGFLISVKDPYAWAYSIAAFEGWYGRRYRLLVPRLFDRWNRRRVDRRLREACRELNRTTAAWLDLRSRHPERTTIVRVEDLAADPRAALEELARRHRLEWRGPGPRLPPAGNMAPARWDHVMSLEREIRQDEHRDRTRRVLLRLADVLHRAVSDEVSWPLMETLGYARRADARSA